MSNAKVRQAWKAILPRMREPEHRSYGSYRTYGHPSADAGAGGAKEGGEVNAIKRLLFWPGEFKKLAAIWAASPWMQEIH